jgi:hypothetical protein
VIIIVGWALMVKKGDIITQTFVVEDPVSAAEVPIVIAEFLSGGICLGHGG